MIKCSRCGAKNDYGAKFCRGCRSALEVNQMAFQPSKKKKLMIWGIGLSVGIIALLVIGVLVFKPEKNLLLGKWQVIEMNQEKTEDGDYVTFYEDGSYDVTGYGQDANEKLTYKIYDQEILFYINGEFFRGSLYTVDGNVLSLNQGSMMNTNSKFKKVD